MKQTAVEWLVYQLENNLEKTRIELEYYINQAKQMEKQQIIDAFKQGIAYWNGDEWKLIDINEYYNKTFKNTKR